MALTLGKHNRQHSLHLTPTSKQCYGPQVITDRQHSKSAMIIRAEESCLKPYGLMLQAPHRPVRELGYAPQQAGVYISRWHHGSPAHRYNLYALHWLTELNGQPVPDLDSFVAIIKSLPDKSFARLKLCQLETTKTKVSRLLLLIASVHLCTTNSSAACCSDSCCSQVWSMLGIVCTQLSHKSRR